MRMIVDQASWLGARGVVMPADREERSTFVDDDAGFIRWRETHARGFIVNHEREPTPRYLKLHRATCPSLQGVLPLGVTTGRRRMRRLVAMTKPGCTVGRKRSAAYSTFVARALHNRGSILPAECFNDPGRPPFRSTCKFDDDSAAEFRRESQLAALALTRRRCRRAGAGRLPQPDTYPIGEPERLERFANASLGLARRGDRRELDVDPALGSIAGTCHSNGRSEPLRVRDRGRDAITETDVVNGFRCRARLFGRRCGHFRYGATFWGSGELSEQEGREGAGEWVVAERVDKSRWDIGPCELGVALPFVASWCRGGKMWAEQRHVAEARWEFVAYEAQVVGHLTGQVAGPFRLQLDHQDAFVGAARKIGTAVGERDRVTPRWRHGQLVLADEPVDLAGITERRNPK